VVCGSGEAAFRAAAESEGPPILRIAATEVAFTNGGIGLHDGSWWADDAIPAFAGLRADLAVVAADSRESLVLTADGARLEDVRIALYDWAAIDFGPDPPQPAAGLEGRVVLDSVVATIVAPDAPGEYAVEVTTGWVGRCLRGDGVGYGRIVVR
jgi:hypothetical protein